MMVFSGPSMLRLLATPVSALVFALVAVASAQAEVRIDITRGYLKPLPIAITEFHGVKPVEAETGRDISNVVSADLERSGLFQPIDPRAFIQTAASLQPQPRFSSAERRLGQECGSTM